MDSGQKSFKKSKIPRPIKHTGVPLKASTCVKFKEPTIYNVLKPVPASDSKLRTQSFQERTTEPSCRRLLKTKDSVVSPFRTPERIAPKKKIEKTPCRVAITPSLSGTPSRTPVRGKEQKKELKSKKELLNEQWELLNKDVNIPTTIKNDAFGNNMFLTSQISSRRMSMRDSIIAFKNKRETLYGNSTERTNSSNIFRRQFHNAMPTYSQTSPRRMTMLQSSIAFMKRRELLRQQYESRGNDAEKITELNSDKSKSWSEKKVLLNRAKLNIIEEEDKKPETALNEIQDSSHTQSMEKRPNELPKSLSTPARNLLDNCNDVAVNRLPARVPNVSTSGTLHSKANPNTDLGVLVERKLNINNPKNAQCPTTPLRVFKSSLKPGSQNEARRETLSVVSKTPLRIPVTAQVTGNLLSSKKKVRFS